MSSRRPLATGGSGALALVAALLFAWPALGGLGVRTVRDGLVVRIRVFDDEREALEAVSHRAEP